MLWGYVLHDILRDILLLGIHFLLSSHLAHLLPELSECLPLHEVI